MFNPDRALKEHIFDILKNDGKSISALSKELGERGVNLHRLILTGYLRALTDNNYLKEKDVPPSKVYILGKGKDKDVYEIVGDGARNISSGPDADLLILYTLYRLFHRPIFFEELRRAGVRDMPPAMQVSNEEKQDVKKFLQRAGIKILDVNLAYVHDDPGLSSKFEDLLSSILCDLLGFSNLIRETKQTKLDFGVGERH
jgi:hypothetical protein